MTDTAVAWQAAVPTINSDKGKAHTVSHRPAKTLMSSGFCCYDTYDLIKPKMRKKNVNTLHKKGL